MVCWESPLYISAGTGRVEPVKPGSPSVPPCSYGRMLEREDACEILQQKVIKSGLFLK